YLRVMRDLDVELAGDFLVMAATLMEVKSRVLVPADPADEEAAGPDPRKELVKQLLEYRKFKDAAAALEEQAERHHTRVARVRPDEPTAPGQTPVRAVELWDLVSAFARLMRETQALQPTSITNNIRVDPSGGSKSFGRSSNGSADGMQIRNSSPLNS